METNLSVTDIQQVNRLHEQAMEQAEIAFVAKIKGDKETAKQKFLEAFQYEREAVNLLLNDYESEPTRSVLFRSAAALAFDAGLLQEAEQMAAIGLSGHPPKSIAEELRQVMKRVWTQVDAANPLENLLQTIDGLSAEEFAQVYQHVVKR